MITRIYLENFLSFGTAQEVPLEPISVIVGANNAGKSNLLKLPAFVREGGDSFHRWWHRPCPADSIFRVAWDVVLPAREERASVGATYAFTAAKSVGSGTVSVDEKLNVGERDAFRLTGTQSRGAKAQWLGKQYTALGAGPFLNELRADETLQHRWSADEAMAPIAEARVLHLQPTGMRGATAAVGVAPLNNDGSNLPTVIARWMFERPERLTSFNEYLRECLPELKRVLLRPQDSGQVTLLFEQKDGERFTAEHVSDGVLVFCGLIAHAMEARDDALILLEEPERGIHPRRLHELVNLLRILNEERRVQFLMATHSTTLLNVFRDAPEAVLLFRRSTTGTVVTPLSKMADLEERLRSAEPGEMLASGIFNEAI